MTFAFNASAQYNWYHPGVGINTITPNNFFGVSFTASTNNPIQNGNYVLDQAAMITRLGSAGSDSANAKNGMTFRFSTLPVPINGTKLISNNTNPLVLRLKVYIPLFDSLPGNSLKLILRKSNNPNNEISVNVNLVDDTDWHTYKFDFSNATLKSGGTKEDEYDTLILAFSGAKPTNDFFYYITDLTGSVSQEPLVGSNARLDNKDVFDVFDNLGAPNLLSTATLNIKKDHHTWSQGSEWFSHDDFDETSVFNAELTSTSTDTDYTIRIGKGGQLYSIKMPESNLGELVPPQALNTVSSWNDEVFMSTYLWTDIHNEDEVGKWGKGQAHASGMYMKPEYDPLNTKPFYGPLFSEKFEYLKRSYYVANMVTIPSASINRADLIQYLKYRDLGSGILEITYYAYNYHEYVCTGASTPWGGVRTSKIGNTIRGTTGNGYEDHEVNFAAYNIKDLGNGWMAQTEDSTDPDSWTIGLVHGKDDHYATERAKYNAGQQSFQFAPTIMQTGSSTGSGRDFDIVNLSNRIDLQPGEGYFRRIYMVFGKLSDVAQTCASLSDDTDYGEVVFTENTATKTALYTKTISGQTILTTDATSASSGKIGDIYATPVAGSVPLIQMRDKTTDQYILSTDQYAICNKDPFTNPLSPGDSRYSFFQDRNIYQIYDETTEWISLLGYVIPSTNPVSGDVVLSDILGSNINFLKGEKNDSHQLLLSSSNLSYKTASKTKIPQNLELLVYPNPSTTVLNIRSPNIINQIKIHNTLGQTVEILSVGKNEIQLNTREYRIGIYHLTIELENNEMIKRSFFVNK